MLQHSLSRTELLIGKDGLNKLKGSKIIVFGVGGVGSFTVEALVRAGVGTIVLVDDDTIYVVDAIDTVSAKIALVEYCNEKGIKIICSMGTGNKFDPTQFKVADIYDTKVCPLAKVMRHELRKREIKSLKVVYSEEMPTKPKQDDVVTCKTGCVCTGGTKKCAIKRQIPGSISFVPPVAGMIIGGEVIKDLLKES